MIANVLVAIIVCLGLTGPICAQSGGQDAAIDPTIAVNIRDLDNKSAKTRRDAAINLHNMGAKASAAAPALLSKLATESDREVRPFIVAAIGMTGAQSPSVVTPLINVLQNERDDETRKRAAEALGRLGLTPESAVPALLAALSDHSADVRSEAAGALGSPGFAALAETIVPALAKAIADKADGDAYNETRSLVGFGAAAAPALPQMRALFANADPAKQLAAARVLAAMGRAAAPAAPQLLSTLGTADPEVRVESAITLLAIGEGQDAAMRALVEALAFDDGLSVHTSQRNEVIPRAAWAVGEYGRIAPGQTVARLAALTNDRDEDVRDVAAKAFEKVLAAFVAGNRVDTIAALKAALPAAKSASADTVALEETIAMLDKHAGTPITFGWVAGSISATLAVLVAVGLWLRRRRRARRVLLSYRRQDSAASCGRIYDRLAAKFGAANVFRDIDSLTPGDLFVQKIREAIGQCDAVIVLIGPQWLAITDASGRRRLDDPADFVRMEIAEAQRQSKRVVPVLIEGAPMPDAKQLPTEIAALTQRNAIVLTDRHFASDMRELLDSLG